MPKGITILDILVVLGYFLAIVYIGRRAKAAASKGEEDYFLAGRKLGKLYQAFLNFGNATEPQGAVSNASFVYKSGASQAWYSFQTVFINPYYWFMNVWFRRVRLLTMADLFVDRFNSRWLGVFYSMFQIGVAVLLIGFGSFTAYKITASLVNKPESAWTDGERRAVEGFRELRELERRQQADELPPGMGPRLQALRELKARDQIYSDVSLLRPEVYKWAFYILFVAVVAAYMVLGGMTAAAFAEALQGTLIIVFSIILIPTGLYALGGWDQLAARIPDKEMFNLFGGEQTGWGIFAITLVSLIQMNALSPNMNIIGSARDEMAARMGVLGLYAKRVMIILWTFAGLIAIALFAGKDALADPDTTWGALSERLLSPVPGLIGLMLAGVIAGVMSNLAAKSMAVSSLFVRNIYRIFRPGASEERGVFVARLTIVVVLVTGLLAATFMKDMMRIVQLVITVNVPFGVLIMVMFFWRRATLPAAWASVLLSVLLNIAFPLAAPWIPAMTGSQSLALRVPASPGEDAAAPGVKLAPVFWEAVIHKDAADLSSPLDGAGRFNMSSPLVGEGRFNMECYMVHKTGLIDVTRLTPRWRENIRYFVDALFPFIVLVLVSLVTRNRRPEQVDFFYGKMKTPVGATPELEAQAIEETRKNPRRFDHVKLLGPKSSWEFTKWDRMDTIGFLACSAGSGALILVFWFVLKLASGA
jgi:Na+/proline symporter